MACYQFGGRFCKKQLQAPVQSRFATMIDVVGIIFALLVAAGGIFGYVKAGTEA